MKKKSQALCNHDTRAKGLTKMCALTSKLVFRTFPLENMGVALPPLSSSSPSLRPYFSLSPTSHHAPLSERLEQSSQPAKPVRKSVWNTSRSSKHPAFTHMTRIDLRRGWLIPLLVLCIRSQTHYLDFSRSSRRSLRQRRSSDEPGNPISCVRLHWEEHQKHYRHSFRSRGPHRRQCY